MRQPEPPARSAPHIRQGCTTRRAARCPREIPAADTGRKRALRAAHRGSRARAFRRCQSRHSMRGSPGITSRRSARTVRTGPARRFSSQASSRSPTRLRRTRRTRTIPGTAACVAQPQALRQGSGRAHLSYGGAGDPALPEPEDHGGAGCFAQRVQGADRADGARESATKPSRRCAANLQRGLPRSRSGSAVPSRKFRGKKSRPATRPCRRR